MPYNAEQARIYRRFFERELKLTKGSLYKGEPFKLISYQRHIVSEVFGRVKRDGCRQIETVYCEIPKKNGKTEFAAGLALACFFLDEEPAAEIYLAASTRGQAGKCFGVIWSMLRMNPDLMADVEVIPSTKTILLKADPSSYIRAISADAGTEDGAAPHVVIFDELHRQKRSDLWSILEGGMDFRTQPLMVAITTAGVLGESQVCWEQHEYARQVRDGVIKDPTYLPVLFGVEDGEDWRDEGQPEKDGQPATGWHKWNPALGRFKRLDKMRKRYEQALKMPGLQNDFRRLQCNEWTAGEERWIDLAQWDLGGSPFAVEELDGLPCWVGVDLSATQDLTAVACVFPWEEKVRALLFFWMPEHEIKERSKKDGVTYDKWADQGFIKLIPGNTIDNRVIGAFVHEHVGQYYDVQEIVYDRWNGRELAVNLEDEGYEMVPISQGVSGMSEASKAFERAVLAGEIIHGGNPVLRWNVDCLSRKQDGEGNIKPVKPDRLKSKKRIDGAVALIMGHGRYKVCTQDQGSVYDERGVISA